MLRIAGSIIGGTLVAFAVVWLVELAGHLVFPMPEDLDLRDPEGVAQAMPAIPLAAKLIVVLAWFSGALLGGAVARRIHRPWWTAWTVAGLVAAAAIVTIMMIPHPAWMQIAAVAAPLLGGLVASHLLFPRLPEGKGNAGI